MCAVCLIHCVYIYIYIYIVPLFFSCMVDSFLSRGNARDQCLEAAGTSRATLINVSKCLTAGNMQQNRHKGEKTFLSVGRPNRF